MKQKRSIVLTAIMLAILLVCFTVPSSALAASRLGNDNHTDTDDYCLRAHDVSIGLSEFSAKSRSELESDIIHASAFAFLIRDTANETGLFVPVTGGYAVDFSNLTEAVSTSGFVVTVTLPAITMSTSTTITFRVFVEDDQPQPCVVRYTFQSATPEHTIPADVLALLPAEENRFGGENVTPATDFPTLRDGAGEWTFSNWTPETATLQGEEFTFVGAWVWTALPVYTVTYQFVSGTGGKTLPNGVLKKLPAENTGVDGDVFTPPDSFRAYHTEDGAWRFHGWDIKSQTIAGGNLVFTGEWRWHKNKAPAVTPTPSIAPTQTLVATPGATPLASPAVTEPAQTPKIVELTVNPQPPLAGGMTGGAQVTIASVLTTLVGTQAFAIVSDLKVLKWYNAKKAARKAKL